MDYWLLFHKFIDKDSSIRNCLITRILAYWYSHQSVYVLWQNVSSQCFSIGMGERQGGTLSPFLFRFYVADLIKSIETSGIGCHIASECITILAYADDILLMAPSWFGLQKLLYIIEGLF